MNQKWTDLELIIQRKLEDEIVSQTSLEQILRILNDYKKKGLLSEEEFNRYWQLAKDIMEDKRASEQITVQRHVLLATLLTSLVAAAVGYKDELKTLLDILGPSIRGVIETIQKL